MHKANDTRRRLYAALIEILSLKDVSTGEWYAFRASPDSEGITIEVQNSSNGDVTALVQTPQFEALLGLNPEDEEAHGVWLTSGKTHQRGGVDSPLTSFVFNCLRTIQAMDFQFIRLPSPANLLNAEQLLSNLV